MTVPEYLASEIAWKEKNLGRQRTDWPLILVWAVLILTSSMIWGYVLGWVWGWINT